MLVRCICLLVLAALAPVARAQDDARALARILVAADAWEWATARTAVAELVRRDPARIAPWLALCELEGLDTRSPRTVASAEKKAILAMRDRLRDAGVELPPRTEHFLAFYIEGANVPRRKLRRSISGTGWDDYLRLRHALLQPAIDVGQLTELADRAWQALADGPFAFYAADRLAHLTLFVGGDRRQLPEDIRARLRAEALERARALHGPLEPRYHLPYPPPSVAGAIRHAAQTAVDHDALLRQHGASGPYADDIRYYRACAALAEGRSLSQKAMTSRGGARRRLRDQSYMAIQRAEDDLLELAHGPPTNRTLAAITALLGEYRRQARRDRRRWPDHLGLARDLQERLRRWPDRERLQLVTTDAHNDPEMADFLVGLSEARAGRPGRAIELYERGFARMAERGLTDTLPANVWSELASFRRARGEWREAFEAHNEYSERSGATQFGRWFLGFLRAAPTFVACIGINALHVFLTMLLAGVFLFSRAAENRAHFRFAIPLAAVYAAGMAYLLFRMEQPFDQSVALALGAGALIFMPTATGRAHWDRVCAPGWQTSGRLRPSTVGMVLASLVLMTAWTSYLVLGHPFQPHPFWIFLRELPMMAPVATALSKDGGLQGVMLVSLAGLQEEVIYRGFTLPVLARYLGRDEPGPFAWWTAQLLTALFWATAHAGMTEPELWKFVHVFGLSIVLGELFRRRGLIVCIVTHAIFNVAALLVLPGFIRWLGQALG